MRKLLFLSITIIYSFQLFAQVTPQEVNAARQVVLKNAATARLTETDLNNSLVSSTYTSAEGIRMVYLLQSFKNIPVYNQIQVLAFRGDKLVSNAGGRIPSIEKKVNDLSATPVLTSRDAVVLALKENKLETNRTITIQSEKNRVLNFGKLGIAEEDVTAELVWIPLENEVRLAWQVLIVSNRTPDAWLISFDAKNGDILHKVNLTDYDHWGTPGHNETDRKNNKQEFVKYVERKDNTTNKQFLPFVVTNATYKVIKYPAESPSHTGGAPADHSNPWTMAPGNATTLGWHFDGTDYHDSTRGNNVYAAEDRLNTDGGGTPNNIYGRTAISTTSQPDLNFPYLYDFTKSPTDATSDNEKAAITNLFYWNNIIHDLTYLYGLDEVSGNFQFNNQGRGGLGNDGVKAQAQDGGGTNNANFLTLADGVKGRMQMYLWTAANPDRDGDLDNGIVVHEYGHGISNRLTGGPAATGCVANGESMGEGWSDYYALMYTTNWAAATPSDGFNIPRGIGTYAQGQPPTGPGIRGFRYCTDMAVNPRVYSVVLPAAVHTRGEYWCMALWEMTWEMIQQTGINPNLFNPAGVGGNSAAVKLVTEAMKLQPCGPGFIDGRDAILKADTLFFGAQYSCAIWKAFAKRGMGRLASQGSANAVNDQVPSFIVDNGVFSVSPSAFNVPEGQNIIYTNTVTGGACEGMTNFFITDTLPTHVTWISGGTYNAGNRTVTMGPVNVTTNATQTFPFTVSINAASYFAPVTHFDEQVTGATIPAAWTASPASGNAWTVSSLQSHTPPNSFFAPDPVVVSDMTLRTTNAYNLSPSTASNYSTLTFWHRFNTEEGWDGGVVEISTNGGVSWTDLGSRMVEGKYNGSLGTGSALAGRQAFTGNVATFMKTVVNLSSFAGQSVNIRFRFASDDNTAPSGGGWFVDDIVLTTEAAVAMKSNLFNSTSQIQSTAQTLTKILPPASGCTPIVITNQPANANACNGGNTSFSVAVTGTNPVYQWQVNTGSGFANIPAGAPYTGTNTATLSITGVTLSMSGYQYRAVVSNTCTSPLNSGAATLTIGQTASIQSHPAASNVCAGTTTTFTINATNGTSYQWQVNTGSGFTNISDGPPYSGTSTATLTITGVTLNMNGYQYRVVLGSCPAGINSNAATLTVMETIVITRQPLNITTCVGSAANFSASTTGTISTYQWQLSTNGGGIFNDIIGANAVMFTIPSVTLAQNGYQYRVILSGGCGTVTSTAAVLTVHVPTTFTLGPNPTVLCLSDTARTLTASVDGGIWSGNGIQGSRFIPALAGLGVSVITYTYTNSFGCVSQQSFSIQVNECPERHITLDKPNSIILFSNPNNGRFNIWMKTDLYTKLGMRVYDSKGRLVASKQLTGLYYDRKEPVDLSRLSSGVYQVYLFNDETGKFVKKTIGIVVYR